MKCKDSTLVGKSFRGRRKDHHRVFTVTTQSEHTGWLSPFRSSAEPRTVLPDSSPETRYCLKSSGHQVVGAHHVQPSFRYDSFTLPDTLLLPLDRGRQIMNGVSAPDPSVHHTRHRQTRIYTHISLYTLLHSCTQDQASPSAPGLLNNVCGLHWFHPLHMPKRTGSWTTASMHRMEHVLRKGSLEGPWGWCQWVHGSHEPSSRDAGQTLAQCATVGRLSSIRVGTHRTNHSFAVLWHPTLLCSFRELLPWTAASTPLPIGWGTRGCSCPTPTSCRAGKRGLLRC